MIVLTIYISDPSSIISSGYDRIKVYRSEYSDGYFSEISDVSTRIVLSTTSKYYNYEDSSVFGTTSAWYKTSYYNSVSGAESSLSSASKGIEVEVSRVVPTYPQEVNFTATDRSNIDTIRTYIGDPKKTCRDYISPTALTGYEGVSDDGYTYSLSSSPSWPLKVIKDSSEYISLYNPAVINYKFLTFSGTQISTASGTLDVWYESFRHSDKEILGVYNNAQYPPYITSSLATTDMMRLCASIHLLNKEINQLAGETSGSFNLQGELSYNPEPALREKRALLEKLKNELKDLVDEATSTSITGVLID